MKIATNIPLPAKTHGRHSPIAQALAECAVGDSFLLPKKHPTPTSLPYHHAKILGIGVITRTTPSGRIRVWRKH